MLRFLADMNLSPLTVNALSNSVITLRLKDTAPEIVTARLKSIIAEISQPLSKGCAVVVDDRTVRIRYLPIR